MPYQPVRQFCVAQGMSCLLHDSAPPARADLLVGRLESSVTLFFATVAIAALTCCPARVRRRPCYACIFSPCSDNRGCEKSVTELSAQPTSFPLVDDTFHLRPDSARHRLCCRRIGSVCYRLILVACL